MNKTIKIIISISIFLIIGFVIIANIQKNNINKAENDNFKIVTSFYPMYVITANIVDGATNVELTNMTETNVGCLHDYTLSVTDMQKVENGDVMVQNGLNLESFMDKIINTYPSLKIIDSSSNITALKANPHIWTSISNYIKQVNNISQKLQEINPQNEEAYRQNTQNYIQKLENLKTKYETELVNLKNKKAICLNEALIYLTNELQIETINIETDHEQSTLSAETIKKVIETMKKDNIQAIFVGKGDDTKNAQTLAKETNAKIYELDTGLTGSLELGSYLKAMEYNLSVLKTIK